MTGVPAATTASLSGGAPAGFDTPDAQENPCRSEFHDREPFWVGGGAVVCLLWRACQALDHAAGVRGTVPAPGRYGTSIDAAGTATMFHRGGYGRGQARGSGVRGGRAGLTGHAGKRWRRPAGGAGMIGAEARTGLEPVVRQPQQARRSAQPSAGRPGAELDGQMGWTLSAWGPLAPWLAVYSTRWLSWRLR